MNMRILCLLALMVCMVAPAVLAQTETNLGVTQQGGQLFITEVEVEVDGDDDDITANNQKISEEAAPGDTVEFKITYFNNFTRNTSNNDIEIEDVEVEVEIFDIDDGSDLDEKEDGSDVDPKDDDDVTVEFTIPLIVDEGNFDVRITVEGDSAQGGNEVVIMDLDLEIEKEDHELRLTSNTLSPESVSCSRSVQVATTVINTGQEDEEDVEIIVISPELGIDERKLVDIDEGDDEDDVRSRNTFRVQLDDNLAPGNYPIETRVIYDDGEEEIVEFNELLVTACAALEEEPEVEEEEPVEQNNQVEVVRPVQQPVQQPVVQQPVVQQQPVVTAQPVTAPALPAEEEETGLFAGSNLGLLIAGQILLLVLAVVIVVVALNNRKRG